MMEHLAVIAFKRHQREALPGAANPQIELAAAAGR